MLAAYLGLSISFNSRSFHLTSSERYSSAVSYCSEDGLKNIMPAKSSVSCSSVLPASFPIYCKSTFAFSESDTASASAAVSQEVTGSCCRMVRFENISALRTNAPFSSRTSREQSRQ